MDVATDRTDPVNSSSLSVSQDETQDAILIKNRITLK